MATQSSVSFSYQKTGFQMLRKFSAWTHLSNFDQSQHKNWTKSVTNAWPWWEKSKTNAFPAYKRRLNSRVRGQFEIKILIVRFMNTSYFKSIFKKIELEPAIIRKVVTCQQTISKEHSHSVGRYLSPRYLSGDTGLRIHCFDSCQLITTWTVTWVHNIRLQAPKLARKSEIKHWYSCGAKCGRSGGGCTVTWLPDFLGWIDFLSYGAPLKIQNWARGQTKYQRKT